MIMRREATPHSRIKAHLSGAYVLISQKHVGVMPVDPLLQPAVDVQETLRPPEVFLHAGTRLQTSHNCVLFAEQRRPFLRDLRLAVQPYILVRSAPPQADVSVAPAELTRRRDGEIGWWQRRTHRKQSERIEGQPARVARRSKDARAHAQALGRRPHSHLCSAPLLRLKRRGGATCNGRSPTPLQALHLALKLREELIYLALDETLGYGETGSVWAARVHRASIRDQRPRTVRSEIDGQSSLDVRSIHHKLHMGGRRVLRDLDRAASLDWSDTSAHEHGAIALPLDLVSGGDAVLKHGLIVQRVPNGLRRRGERMRPVEFHGPLMSLRERLGLFPARGPGCAALRAVVIAHGPGVSRRHYTGVTEPLQVTALHSGLMPRL